MWVRLSEWMIYDGEPPMPKAGAVVSGLGLRVRGEVTPAPPHSDDGVVEMDGGQPDEVMYRVTGRAGHPRDIETDTGRGPSQHAGVEFVLTVGSNRYQVQADGWAKDIPTRCQLTVLGRFEVVGAYEWEDFGLEESRADWLVQATAPADHGDTMLDVVRFSQP